MRRLTVTLIMAWTLLLLPALCTGGWLLHPCDCGSSLGCEHESECASDPCEIGVARSDSWAQDYDDAHVQATNPSALLDDTLDRPERGPIGHQPRTTPLIFRKALPFPPADLPLLI